MGVGGRRGSNNQCMYTLSSGAEFDEMDFDAIERVSEQAASTSECE